MCNIVFFTLTTENHACSLANFHCQYVDRQINLNYMQLISKRERAIRQFVIVKNKRMSLFNASVLLLTMNFVKKSSMRIHLVIASWIHSYSDNVMTKFMINNRTDA